jgi:hypothetical protein
MNLTLECISYNIQMGDSLRGVAERFASDKSAAGLKAYMKELQQNRVLEEVGVDMDYPDLPIPRPYGSICLPIDTKKQDKELLHRAASHVMHANRKPYQTRRNVDQLATHHDLTTIASTAMLVRGLHRENKGIEAVAGVAESLAITIPSQFQDYVKERSKLMRADLEAVQNKLKAYQETSKAERTAPRQEYYKAMKEFNEKFNVEVRKLNMMLRRSSKKILLSNAKKIAKESFAHRIPSESLIQSEAYRTVADVGKYAAHIGNHIAVFDFGSVWYQTGEAYREGGDWDGELLEGLSGFVGGWAGGQLVYFLITPTGLLVFVLAVGVSIIASEFLKYVTNAIHKKQMGK